MTASTGLSASCVSGTQQTSSANRSIWGSPSVATAITLRVAGPALHDVADQLVVDRDRVATATSGHSASSSEIGPCFSSPAA